MNYADIIHLLGKEHAALLSYTCSAIPKNVLHTPSPSYIDDIFPGSDRNAQTLRSLDALFSHGRLGGTGYLSILPVDQGVEHSAGASFAPNPMYFDPQNIIHLAIEGGCNAVASTLGGLGILSRRFAHKIPFIVKLNHNELLSFPNKSDQTMFATVKQAWDMGAVAVGATIYFGSPESARQITEVSHAFAEAHSLGMATVLWCYLRNGAFKKDGVDYHVSADLTGQANYLGATIGADIIKQKLPENNGGYKALSAQQQPYGKWDQRMYTELATDNPVDLCRYQVLNCFSGRIGLINSGGPSGIDDLKNAVIAAVINKRAGGTGLIAGRKVFQKDFTEGLAMLDAIQNVYLEEDITIA